MSNYKINKNKEWKEIEINGEMKEIPIGWDVKALNFLCDVRDGTHESPKFVKKGVPFVTTKNLINGKLNFSSAKFISEENHKNFIKRSKVDEGDILTGMIGTIGNPVLVKNQVFDFSIKNLGLIKTKNKISQIFLYYDFCQYLKNKKGGQDGGVLKFMSLGELREIEIFYPHSFQQISIASILSAQESIINDMETLVEKYETRLRYLSEELLSGRLRIKEVDGKNVFYKNTEWKDVEINGEFKEIPADWEVSKIRGFFDSYIGGEYGEESPFEDSTKTEIFTLYIFNGNKAEKSKITRYVKNTKIKNRTLSIGDILLEKSGGTVELPVGRMVQFMESDEKIYSAVNFINILKTSNKYNKEFIFKLLSYFYMLGLTKKYEQRTTGIANLKVEEFLSHETPFTPNLKEQELILRIIKRQGVIIENKKNIFEKEKKKFTFLLNNLLSGNYLVEENTTKE